MEGTVANAHAVAAAIAHDPGSPESDDLESVASPVYSPSAMVYTTSDGVSSDADDDGQWGDTHKWDGSLVDSPGEYEPEEDPPDEDVLTEWPHPPSPPPPPSPPSSPPDEYDDDDDDGAVAVPMPNGECIGCGLRSTAG